jgi:hypothetical protein
MLAKAMKLLKKQANKQKSTKDISKINPAKFIERASKINQAMLTKSIKQVRKIN